MGRVGFKEIFPLWLYLMMGEVEKGEEEADDEFLVLFDGHFSVLGYLLCVGWGLLIRFFRPFGNHCWAMVVGVGGSS